MMKIIILTPQFDWPLLTLRTITNYKKKTFPPLSQPFSLTSTERSPTTHSDGQLSLLLPPSLTPLQRRTSTRPSHSWIQEKPKTQQCLSSYAEAQHYPDLDLFSSLNSMCHSVSKHPAIVPVLKNDRMTCLKDCRPVMVWMLKWVNGLYNTQPWHSPKELIHLHLSIMISKDCWSWQIENISIHWPSFTWLGKWHRPKQYLLFQHQR